jgi:hypothetical protein
MVRDAAVAVWRSIWLSVAVVVLCVGALVAIGTQQAVIGNQRSDVEQLSRETQCRSQLAVDVDVANTNNALGFNRLLVALANKAPTEYAILALDKAGAALATATDRRARTAEICATP